MLDRFAQERAIRAKHAARWLYEDRGTDIDPAAWKWLREHGVDHEVVTNATGPVCRVPFIFWDDGDITFDDLGEPAFAFVVTGEDAETEIDVVAFAVRDPETFGTLLGQAAFCGAAAVTNPASFCGGPCPLWRTPLRWLQADCQGAVVLDPGLAYPLLAAVSGQFVCETWEHADWLVKSGSAPKSKIVIPKLARAA